MCTWCLVSNGSHVIYWCFISHSSFALFAAKIKNQSAFRIFLNILSVSLFALLHLNSIKSPFALCVHAIYQKYLFIYASGNQSSHSRDPKPFSEWVFGFILLFECIPVLLSYVLCFVVDIERSAFNFTFISFKLTAFCGKSIRFSGINAVINHKPMSIEQ